MLKSKAELNQLAPDDVNIYVDGLIKPYIERPNELKDMCLAEFQPRAAFYKFQKKASKKEDPWS